MAWKDLKRTDFNFMEPLYLKKKSTGGLLCRKEARDQFRACNILYYLCICKMMEDIYQVNQFSWQYSPLRLILLISFRSLFFFYYILSYDHWHLHLLTVDSGKPCKKRKFIPRSCRVIIWNTSWYHVVLPANVWLFGTSYQI